MAKLEAVTVIFLEGNVNAQDYNHNLLELVAISYLSQLPEDNFLRE